MDDAPLVEPSVILGHRLHQRAAAVSAARSEALKFVTLEEDMKSDRCATLLLQLSYHVPAHRRMLLKPSGMLSCMSFLSLEVVFLVMV